MIFDVLKRSHGANKFTDNKFINGTHSTPVRTEYPTLRTWVTCVKINRSEVHPILTLVVKFKLYPTSVAQVHPPPPPAATLYVQLCQTGENSQKGVVWMWGWAWWVQPPTPSTTYIWTNQRHT